MKPIAIQQGLAFLWQGFRVSKKKNIRAWLILPILANSIFFSLAWFWSSGWLSDLIQHWTSHWQFTGFFEFINPVINFLRSVVKWLIWLVMLVLLASFFTVAVQLLSAPFMGFLAEKVDILYAKSPLPDESIWSLTKRVIWREIIKFFYWSWRALLIFLFTAVLSFMLAAIPIVNLLGPALWFLWASWMMGIQYMDYGADNRIVPFKQSLKQFRQQRWLVVGFGGGVLALTMVPLVNLVIMPVAVVGGTLAWLHVAGLSDDDGPKPLQSDGRAQVNPLPKTTDAPQTRE